MVSGVVVVWLILIFVVISKSKGSRQAGRVWSSPLPPEQPRSPDELVRDRYARGEIGWPEYQEVLVNLLKDRYVRGELELDEYEQRASLVLEGQLSGHGEASARLKAPDAAAGPEPGGLEPTATTQPVAAEPAQSVVTTAQSDGAGLSTATEDALSAQRRQVQTDNALDALRRRFLSGELTPDEYEEQCRRLMAA